MVVTTVVEVRMQFAPPVTTVVVEITVGAVCQPGWQVTIGAQGPHGGGMGSHRDTVTHELHPHALR